MKKFSIKTLLLVVMVIVLALSMVACNDDKGGNNPPPQPTETLTPAAYFTNLWDLTKGIGDETIASTEDVALHADLAFSIELQNMAGVKQESLDIGIAVDVVLDRSTDDSRNTAFKAQVYDPSNNRENYFTAYFFFNDPTNVYFDFAGQNLKMSFDYKNDTFAGSFHKLIFENKIGVTDTNEGRTIAEIINSFTSDMGENWDLDSFLDGIISATGINIKQKLEDLKATTDIDIENLVQQMLKVDLFTPQGKLNIKNILTGEVAGNIFKADKTKVTENNGVKTSTTQIDATLFGALSTFLGSNEKLAGLSSLLNNQTIIQLDYTEKNNEIDSFTISASFGSITANAANGAKRVHPVVALTINELEICKANVANEIAIDKANYSTDLVFDSEITLAVDGLAIDPRVFDIDLDTITLSNANLTLGVKGKVDLYNKENNGTVANVYVALNGSHVIDLSFANGSLALKVNQDAKLNDLPVVGTLVNLFGQQAYNMIEQMFTTNGWDMAGLQSFATAFFAAGAEDGTLDYTTINPDFKGAVWTGIDIVGGFQDMLDKVTAAVVEISDAYKANGMAGVMEWINNQFNQTKPEDPDTGNEGTTTPGEGDDAVTTANPDSSTIEKVIDTIKKAIPLFNTANNKLTISSNNVFANVIEICRIHDREIAATTTDAAAIANIVDRIIEKDASNWLQKFAKFFIIDDSDNTDKTDDVIAKEFLTKIFTGLEGSLTYDIGSHGVSTAISLKANGSVSIALTETTTLAKYDAANFVDVAAEYEADQDKTGWVVYDLTPETDTTLA